MTTEPAKVDSLAGYGILVTGGGSGIGAGAAARFASEGASVTICGRTEDKLVAAAEKISAVAANGGSVKHVVCDVTVEDQMKATVAAAAEATGTLDGVFACAGGSTGLGPVTQLDYEAWQSTIAINLHGTFLTIKHAAPIMASQGKGAIVGMSSIAGSTTHRWFGGYGPAKAGIDMLVRTAADELGPSGVRVNSVQPGVVATEIMEAITAGGPVIDDYLAKMPIARQGEVDDVVGLVRYLIGPESTWITGQNIGVDGGMNLRAGPDYSSFIEPVYGADGLRGVVADG